MKSTGRSPLPPVPSTDVHRFSTEFGEHLLVVNGSRLYDVTPALGRVLDAVRTMGGEATAALLRAAGLDAPPAVTDVPLKEPPLHSLSLAVAQQCNLGCTYCYANGGDFGRKPRRMEASVARRAIDFLLSQTAPGERAFIAFMGGEPLTHRPLIHEATAYAVKGAHERGVQLGFGLTTNGTLLQPDDAEFLSRHGFALTLSLDGVGAVHDRLRPFKGGRPSFDRIIKRVQPLLGRLPITVRVTVTPRNLNLEETLVDLVGMRFHAVGFSPMLSSPTGCDQLQPSDFEPLLEQLIACGRRFERETLARRRFPFANLTTALKELHRGAHRPYPCGAGAGYLGVSAEGQLSACHRFVESDAGQLGEVFHGLDRTRQDWWLAERHVHRQAPCHQCWARYLCGGGCHHEVLGRGRVACDFIRAWLDYGLKTYIRLQHQAPWFFADLPPSDSASR